MSADPNLDELLSDEDEEPITAQKVPFSHQITIAQNILFVMVYMTLPPRCSRTYKTLG